MANARETKGFPLTREVIDENFSALVELVRTALTGVVPGSGLYRAGCKVALGGRGGADSTPPTTPPGTQTGFFPVRLTLGTYSQMGDATHQCDYTYTVTDYATGLTTLAKDAIPNPATNIDITGANGWFVRPSLGQQIAATKGMAMYDADGTLRIFWCNEVPAVSAC